MQELAVSRLSESLSRTNQKALIKNLLRASESRSERSYQPSNTNTSHYLGSASAPVDDE